MRFPNRTAKKAYRRMRTKAVLFHQQQQKAVAAKIRWLWDSYREAGEGLAITKELGLKMTQRSRLKALQYHGRAIRLVCGFPSSPKL